MAHGAPDCGNVLMPSQAYRLDDLGEHAARLGSVVLYYRSGNVLFMEDFESGLDGWEQVAPGPGSSIVLETLHSYMGSISCQMVASAGGATETTIIKHLPLPTSGHLGFSLLYQLWQEVHYIVWEIDYSIAGARYYLPIGYYPNTGVLVQQSGWPGASVFATHYIQPQDISGFHQMKMVVDIDTPYYVSLDLDGIKYDLTGYSAPPFAALSCPRLDIRMDVAASGGDEAIVTVDNVVVTFNEP